MRINTKNNMLNTIDTYDKSIAVNGFIINDVTTTRFTVEQRLNIDTSLFADTDGKAVHPNEAGHSRIASLVIGYLESLRK